MQNAVLTAPIAARATRLLLIPVIWTGKIYLMCTLRCVKSLKRCVWRTL